MIPIVFDLYGTLLKESEVYYKFYQHLLKKYPLSVGFNEFITLFFKYQREYVFSNSEKSFKE